MGSLSVIILTGAVGGVGIAVDEVDLVGTNVVVGAGHAAAAGPGGVIGHARVLCGGRSVRAFGLCRAAVTQ